ncbi:hypothetical protein ACFOW1_01085 [Parasediminibacterium paludis]|uniref:Uncharacterized protein n=1 Tax=Parasediminibacterium paludis TaxID=908966 RepID=A0ABV8PT91_9BACT
MSNKNICCEILESKIETAGKRGLAVIPFKSPYKPFNYIFFLQSRNIDEENKTGIHTVIDIAIKYCPWCGTNLSTLIEIDEKLIESIAFRNKHLIKLF